MVRTHHQWSWERPDPLRSGSSGDLAKLFRNEAIKQPGSLALDAPNPIATVMAREVVQNSWDAANELRAELLSADRDSAPDFELVFRFRRLTGSAKRQFVEALDLRDLASHRTTDNRTSLGLAPADCLDDLDSDRPLQVLDVVEHGACGMSGPFTDARSKLFLALISVGYTAKRDGAGGSFGYGKAGLIRGSAIRTLAAYTCFRERPDDPGVTRRLLGMTYWGQHEVAGSSFTGFARLGEPADGSALPFVDREADRLAARIGLDLRHASDLDELGTTITLVDPTVGAAELCEAIERNWWPALVENAFVVRIVDHDGSTLMPRPRKNPVLTSFVRGLELATTKQDNNLAEEARRDLGVTYAIAGEPLRVGVLGIAADVAGWSYPDAASVADGTTDASLVALVRGPRMVVEYLDLGPRLPLVRGVFVADQGIDDLLRQTEPKAHDSWQTNLEEEGIDPVAPKVARSVLQKIRAEAREFQRRLRPPSPRDADVTLPLLQDLFRVLTDGRAPISADPASNTDDDVAIAVHHEIEVVDELRVAVAGRVDLTLSDRLGDETAFVALRISYVFVEDGRAGGDCDLDIDLPAGWSRTPTGVSGVLGPAPARVAFRTAPYRSEWTGRLIVAADRVRDGAGG